jgi:hypothetical protein
MGKHETSYPRVERDFYPTPLQATKALLEHIDVRGKSLWEFSCGDGAISKPLKAAGAKVFSTDIAGSYADTIYDFLSDEAPPISNYDGLITNPPYGWRCKLITRFIEAGLRRMSGGFLILLLPVDCDSARRRVHVFGSCPQFVGKIVLTERLVWFQDPLGKKAAPKENHCWYLWSGGAVTLRAPQAPVLHYAPKKHQPHEANREERAP